MICSADSSWGLLCSAACSKNSRSRPAPPERSQGREGFHRQSGRQISPASVRPRVDVRCHLGCPTSAFPPRSNRPHGGIASEEGDCDRKRVHHHRAQLAFASEVVGQTTPVEAEAGQETEGVEHPAGSRPRGRPRDRTTQSGEDPPTLQRFSPRRHIRSRYRSGVRRGATRPLQSAAIHRPTGWPRRTAVWHRLARSDLHGRRPGTPPATSDQQGDRFGGEQLTGETI